MDAQTQEQEAQAYKAERIPKAKMWAKNTIRTAEAYAIEKLAEANADIEELLQLIKSKDPNHLLKERLYRERLSRIFSDIGRVRFLPPPKSGMRINVSEGP